MKQQIALGCLMLSALAANGQRFHSQTVAYTVDGTDMLSAVVWPVDSARPLPGILMVPNWMGVTEGALAKAQRVANDGYVVMVVDMYGRDVRPANGREAAAAAGAVRADRSLMRARALAALQVFRAVPDLPLSAGPMGAIGFCFGGGTVLELARTGEPLAGVVSFHGDLLSPTLETDAGTTRAAVLVLHGADDPYVPQEHVTTFIETMRRTAVDWQLVQYGGAVHSFTDPSANMPGQAQFNPAVARQAFTAMRAFFAARMSPASSLPEDEPVPAAD
jgi:dienelactone hydrolase